METIKLKPRPLRVVIFTFIIIFIPYSFVKYLELVCYSNLDISFFSNPDTWLFLRARGIEGLTAVVVCLLVHSFVYPSKCLHIILNEKTLQAPMKKGIRLKSVTVNLSDIRVSRTFKDRLNGAQIVTRNGERLHIGALYYGPKAVPHLLDEIEKRVMENKDRSENRSADES